MVILLNLVLEGPFCLALNQCISARAQSAYRITS